MEPLKVVFKKNFPRRRKKKQNDNKTCEAIGKYHKMLILPFLNNLSAYLSQWEYDALRNKSTGLIERLKLTIESDRS